MTLILDSGGLSALAGRHARLAELRLRGLWPPEVPAVVLVETPTAFAAGRPDPIVLTTDPRDMGALAQHVAAPITIVEA